MQPLRHGGFSLTPLHVLSTLSAKKERKKSDGQQDTADRKETLRKFTTADHRTPFLKRSAWQCVQATEKR